MSQTTVNLGMVPNNRGEYNSAETYYKDNIVQYNGSSYICTAAMDLEHPSGITGVAPYDSDPTQPNTGWAVFVNNQGGGDDGIYDVSAAHMTDNTPKSYNSLSDALTDIIVAKRKGGMSMRFLLQLYTVVKSTTDTSPASDVRYNEITYDLPDSGTHVASDFPSAFSTELSGLVAGTASYYYKKESGGTYTTWTVTKVQTSDNSYVQFRYMLPYMNTTAGNTAFVSPNNWQSVEDVVRGVIVENEIAGNNASWRVYSSTKTIAAGQTVYIKFFGSITFAGTSDSQTFLYAVLKRKSDNTMIGNSIYSIHGSDAFSPKSFIFTASEECYIYAEGRWHDTETLNVGIYDGSELLDAKIVELQEQKEDKTEFENIVRGKVAVVHCSSINFDNTNHKAVIAGVAIADPSSSSIRKTIAAAEVAYTFNANNTTFVLLVYDLNNSEYIYVSTGTLSSKQVPIAALIISGNATTSGKVEVVCWSSIENWAIDSVNLNTRVDTIDNKTLISQYSEADYWVDGGKWVAKNANYGAIIIPYAGAQKLKVTANNSIACRIAFANTYNPSTIVSGTTPVDGTGNQSTSAGQTRMFDVPNTCNYIVVNCRYGSATPNSLPASLLIDGVEYMKNMQDTLTDTSKTAFDAEVKVNNLVDNNVLVKADTALSILRGGAVVVYCKSINFDNYNHVVEVDALAVANRSNNTRLTVPAATVDYSFSANSTTLYSFVYDFSDGSYKFISMGTNNYNQAVIAALLISGNSSANPNTSKVVEVTWCSILNYSINGVNATIQEAMGQSIIGRNIPKDAAVRAVGTKAINADIKPLSFIHVSDIHTKSNNYKCFVNACEYYEHYSNIAAMIVTGDIVWDDNRDLMTWYDEALQRTTKPVLNVVGNHDSGQWHIDLTSVTTDKQCYDKFIAPYVSGWGVTQPTDAATNGLSYYYKDFSTEKVRLIVLNEFETEYEIDPNDNTKLKYSRESRAMRQAQVTWLINTLTNTPSDYGVIVAMHQPLGVLADEDNAFVSFDLVGSAKFSVYSSDAEWLAKIINAYATKTALTLSVTQTGAVVQNDATLDCSCDFTSVTSEFICVLCGHVHRDYIGHLANYPAIPILAVGADNLLYTSGFQPRAKGTPSEDLFNVVNIDRNRKTIKVIRIGSDASVVGQVRDQMIMNYATT